MSAADKLIIYILEHHAEVDSMLRCGGIQSFMLDDETSENPQIVQIDQKKTLDKPDKVCYYNTRKRKEIKKIKEIKKCLILLM